MPGALLPYGSWAARRPGSGAGQCASRERPSEESAGTCQGQVTGGLSSLPVVVLARDLPRSLYDGLPLPGARW
jgi:hypothetical protein